MVVYQHNSSFGVIYTYLKENVFTELLNSNYWDTFVEYV